MDHIELGKLGEFLAKKYLEKKRYQILETNWRFEHYEVDIIARIGKDLVFVEVKSRNTDVFGHPSSFVLRKQQLHLADAAEAYLYLHPEQAADIRYDVISIIVKQGKHTLEHIEDAFWPDNLGMFSADI